MFGLAYQGWQNGRVRRDAMVDSPELADRYMRLVDGFVTTQLLYVAASLDVGGRLAGGPISGPDLAASLGVDCAALIRVLRGLVAEGLLDEDDHGRFALTPLGGCLTSLRGATIARGALYYDAAAGLMKSVRDGGTSFEHVHGDTFFEYLRRHPDQYRRVPEVHGRTRRAGGPRRGGRLRLHRTTPAGGCWWWSGGTAR